MCFSYLGLSTSHQVFELQNFVVDGGAVALLDGVVSSALLPLVGQTKRLTADGDAVDWELVSIHHDWHGGQDGAIAHKSLRGGGRRREEIRSWKTEWKPYQHV